MFSRICGEHALDLFVLVVIDPSRPKDEASLLRSHAGLDELFNNALTFSLVNLHVLFNLLFPGNECLLLLTESNGCKTIANLVLSIGHRNTVS